MRVHRFVLAIVIATIATTPLPSQEAKSCRGPGAAFGVTAYQCASCEFKREQNMRPQFGFHAEPIVLQTSPTSALRPGDIIESINGQPITTRAGADQFTYPKAGPSVLKVRRNGSPIDITASRGDCETGEHERSTEPGQSVGLWKGVVAVIDSTIQVPHVDGAGVISADRSRLGLAVSCTPSCTRAKASDGTTYWKFDAYPPIIGVRDAGPADKAGIRVGDVVVAIDGLSVLEADGALRFLRAEKRESVQLTVLRDGKRVEHTLKLR
jgi:C-terminal processing protease CtpA/Prc